MAFSVRHKLIFAFSGLALFITLVAFFAMLFTFRAGFLQYLNDLRNESIEKLSQAISTTVNTEEEWNVLIENKRNWHRWINQNIGVDRDHRGDEAKKNKDNDSRGYRSFRNHVERSYLLLDKNKKSVFEEISPEEKVHLTSITIEDTLVGYVGVKQLVAINNGADRIFFKKQTQYFIYIAIVACLLAVLLAFFIARWMTAPIQRLVLAVNQLMSKDYTAKVNYQAHDEIGSLVQSFNQLGKSLADHEHSQQQWIADISHELRTPLSTLRGELEAMLDGVRDLTVDRISSLHEDVLRLQRLVDDLHELSLSDSGTLRYRFESVDVQSLLSSLFSYHENEIKSHQLSYEIKKLTAEHSAIVYADSDRLYQLFKNLLQNSLRYTNSGGSILVEVSQLKLAGNEEFVQVDWEDSSPGVDPGSIDKLFDRLYREDKSRNRAVGGSGLGLSICKAIVEGHGGHVSASASTLGGLKVRIKIPVKKFTSI